MLEVLILAVLLALATVSATVLVRAVITVKSKPFTCDVCMAFWSLLGSGTGLYLTRTLGAWQLAIALLAAHGLAVLLLRRLAPLPKLPGEA